MNAVEKTINHLLNLLPGETLEPGKEGRIQYGVEADEGYIMDTSEESIPLEVRWFKQFTDHQTTEYSFLIHYANVLVHQSICDEKTGNEWIKPVVELHRGKVDLIKTGFKKLILGQ